MSMHQVEAFVEVAVEAVAKSSMTTEEKRNVIFGLFEMQSYCDCDFTNLRTIEAMVECQYSFVFAPEQMPDYEENKEFYDNKGDDGGFEQGDVYFCLPEDELPEQFTGKVCVDSGSFAWEMLVDAGLITGEGAEPIEPLDPLEVLRTAIQVMDEADQNDEYLSEGRVMLAVFSGALEDAEGEDFRLITGMTRAEFEAEVDL